MAGFMGLPLGYNLMSFFFSVPLQIRAWEWNAPPIKSVNWWKARQLVSARMFATAVTLRSRSAVQMEMSIQMNAIFLSSLVSLLWRTNHWTCPTKANVVSHLCLKCFSACVFLWHIFFLAIQLLNRPTHGSCYVSEPFQRSFVFLCLILIARLTFNFEWSLHCAVCRLRFRLTSFSLFSSLWFLFLSWRNSS